MQWIKIAMVMALGVGASAFAAPQCPADAQLAKLVASSQIIVTATSQATPEQIREAAVKNSYFSMPLDQVEWLKGRDDGRSLKVDVYSQDRDYAPSIAATKAAFGHERLMFLAQRDEGGVKYYFAGYTPAALQTASSQNLMATGTEIARQASILTNWSADTQLPHYFEIKQLIAQMDGLTREDDAKQQEIFQALAAFEKDAVPAIVAQMDDRRKLAVPSLSFTNNTPDAF